MITLILSLTGIAAIVGIAVSVGFYHRRLFLTEGGALPVRDMRAMSIGLSLLGIAAVLGFWAALELTPPERRNLVYTLLPLVGLSCYGLEAFFLKRISAQWKKSPWFWMAVIQPLVGCILVMVFIWHERNRKR